MGIIDAMIVVAPVVHMPKAKPFMKRIIQNRRMLSANKYARVVIVITSKPIARVRL